MSRKEPPDDQKPGSSQPGKEVSVGEQIRRAAKEELTVSGGGNISAAGVDPGRDAIDKGKETAEESEEEVDEKGAHKYEGARKDRDDEDEEEYADGYVDDDEDEEADDERDSDDYGQRGKPKPRVPLYLHAVRRELMRAAPGLKGTVWEHTTGNALDLSGDDPASWILQVPDCWGWGDTKGGSVPEGLGKPGVKALLARIRETISRAERCVDITGFGVPEVPFLSPATPFPDGKFAEAMGAGLKVAAKAAAARGKPLKVRVLAGVLGIDFTADPKTFHATLMEMLGEYAGAVDLNVASMTTRGNTSYNHTKFVLVDGRYVIHGGINWMANFYYQDTSSRRSSGYGGIAPVTDLDIALRGPAALSAGKFLDKLWTWTCENASVTKKRGAKAWLATNNGKPGEAMPRLYKDAEPVTEGTLQVIAVGSLGYGIQEADPTSRYLPPPAEEVEQAACKDAAPGSTSNNATNTDRDFMTVNPDANALRALLARARKKIVLSQQDITGFSHYPLYHPLFDVRLLDILAAKMVDGVKVRIVISNPGSPDYSNIKDIRTESVKQLFDRVRLCTTTTQEANNVLRRNLQLAPLRVSLAPTWPENHKYRLHTKIVCVDYRAFYVGSRNVYPDTTQDHGFIIEDAAAARQLKVRFLDKEWRYSSTAAIYDYKRPGMETPEFE